MTCLLSDHVTRPRPRALRGILRMQALILALNLAAICVVTTFVNRVDLLLLFLLEVKIHPRCQ